MRGVARKQKTPFTLTPTEAKTLELLDNGMSDEQIRQFYGWSSLSTVHSAKYPALEKRRLMQRLETDGRHAGFSSPSRAHGVPRMPGTK